MTEHLPLVSISCFTYNHEKFIRQAIESFINQKTNFAFEVLIHDDASTDNTAAIIREYELKHPEIIKPVYQIENQYSKSISMSVTFQFPRARGKYIAMCEGDDFWVDPYKLQKQVDLLESMVNKNIVAVVTNVETCDMEGNIIEKEQLITPPVNKEGRYNLHDFFKNDFHYFTPTVMFKAECINSITPKMKSQYNVYFGDWLMWIFLHLEGDFYFLNQSTSAYRINLNSVTHTVNFVNRWKADFEIRKKLRKILPVEYDKYLTNSWHAYFRISLAYKKNKQYLIFVYYQIRSFLCHPLLYLKRMKEIIFR
jgi:glycosyltransferase involved in cell wall biosynthesis